ncbi:type II secretion system protein GspK [Oceanisphaera sp. IT1-181]|uniref:general secretion pathway protein GspK n=1 Tax=Oceanisphaera sp. IT1-181 TaxID=3081199 RepID=UPI0029C9B733|nr:type II secretion system protein GspK [Oceanisphaera sp. IT1-181]
MTSKKPSDLQRGIALLSVLWVLMLLTVIASSLALTSRSLGQQTRNITNAQQARLAAEAGIQLALFNLSMAPEQRAWLADGSPYHFLLDDTQIWVATFNDSGRIDVNGADQALLARLFRAAEVEDDLAAELVDAILDWRDNDDLTRLNGAEYDDYIGAGREQGPANAPFTTVAELQLVLGMTAEIYRRIRHALTTHNPENDINPQFAPRLVLLSLPNVDETRVSQFIEDRRSHQKNGLPPPDPDLLSGQPSSRRRLGVNYTIHTEARIGTGHRHRLTATLRWQRGRPDIQRITQEHLPLFTEPEL